MNATIYPWENMSPGQRISRDIIVPVTTKELLVCIEIGEDSNYCRRSLIIHESEPKSLLDIVTGIKKKCANQSCNLCCSRPTKGIGIVTLVTFTIGTDPSVTLRLSYKS